jgi:L-fucose mutarotase
MLKGQLLHPEILAVLGKAGHSSQILIADGNYPFLTKLGPSAKLVNLNLSPGVVTCTQVLAALVTAIPIEAAAVMQYATTGPNALKADPPIWNEFRQILHDAQQDVELKQVERFAFYETAGTKDVCLTIATAESAIYANLLLTIGVVKPK